MTAPQKWSHIDGCSTGHKSLSSWSMFKCSFSSLVLISYLMLYKRAFTSRLTGEPCSQLSVWAGPQDCGSYPGHYSTDSSSKWRQQQKMAVPVSGIFWLHFCTMGGCGDASSIFIYSLWSGPKRGTDQHHHPLSHTTGMKNNVCEI